MNMNKAFRPIWEMELVISGAVILGLFQLPQLADQAYRMVSPHLAFDRFFIYFMGYYIIKLSINTLIGAFLLHFVVRSFWVAIMGLREVFPDEVDLEKTDFGPMTKRMIQARGVNLASLQQKMDHFASMIFSILFLMIVMLLIMGLYAGLCIASALILLKFGATSSFFRLFLLSFAVIYGLPTLFTSIGGTTDKWLKNDLTRVDKYPKLATLAHICLLLGHYMFLGFIMQPVAVVLRTRVNSIQFTGYTMVIFVVIITSFFLQMKTETMELDSYIYMPIKSAPQQVSTACYDTLRRADDSMLEPSIQADIINGENEPIRLFLPYHVLHSNQLLEELCPELEPLHADGWYDSSFFEDLSTEQRLEKVEIALNCARKLYEVSLDDEPVLDQSMLFTRHHLTEQGGFLIYIPATDLKPGQHTLNIQIKRQRKKKVITEEYFIPFWLMAGN